MGSEINRGFPYNSFPSGWFQLGWTDEFPVGEARPLKRFSQDLVAFRGESGELRVFDAYCPHFGAHLGYGGCVEGNELVCPFHGWRFDGDGAVVDVPYSKRRRTANRLVPWSIVEQDGLVFVWHDANRAQPWCDPPPVLDHYGYSTYPCETYRNDQRMLPQMMVENSCDVAHFKSVHRAANVPKLANYEADGTLFRNRVEWPHGGYMTNDLHGVGLVFTVFMDVFAGMTGGLICTAATPIDDESCTLFLTNWVVKGPDDPEEISHAGKRFLSVQESQSLPDRVIWEHMRWNSKPATTPEESKVFHSIRSWAGQFYPAG